VAAVLRFLVFPRGRSYSAPSDQLGHEVAQLISTPGPSRDRLTRNTYTTDKTSAVGMYAEALELAHRLEPLERTLREAEKAGRFKTAPGGSRVLAAEEARVISEQDARQLLRLEQLTHEIVSVDDFDSHELGTHPFKQSGA
jgi:acyl-CoA dehydrogenase